MAETVASLASLLKLGANLPLQPPRFAKVTAVSGDTVTVSLGSGTADAVRCCACAVDDVVLLETMPSGTLAAVATKGASGGGGGGVQSVSIGTVNGATFTNSGTAENVVLDLTVPAPTCTESSGGHTWQECQSAPAPNGAGWYEQKWSDGRLTVWVWDWYNMTAATRTVTYSFPSGPTAFTDYPVFHVSPGRAAASAAITYTITAFTVNTSASMYITKSGTNCAAPFSIRMDGHWN